MDQSHHICDMQILWNVGNFCWNGDVVQQSFCHILCEPHLLDGSNVSGEHCIVPKTAEKRCLPLPQKCISQQVPPAAIIAEKAYDKWSRQ